MKHLRSIVALALSLAFFTLIGATPSAQERQDKYALKALNGVAWSEFRGYEDWQDVSVSTTETGIKAILANPIMMQAYRAGTPGNGKPFPEGSATVKIEWNKAKNADSPYFVEVPQSLKSVSFIEKNSKRFQDSSGWGYAQFILDPATGAFKPYGENASFGTKVCYQCHTRVASTDYIFTRYLPR